MFKLFIRRPILSAVISVIFVCLGVLAIVSLPITQYPDIVPPSVTYHAVSGHRAAFCYGYCPLYGCQCRCYDKDCSNSA